MAAKGKALRLCKCGDPVNVAELREQSQAEAESIHLTKTPAGMSEWLRENYGYEVSRKTITDALRRGKLPSSKPVENGYWEFNIRDSTILGLIGAGGLGLLITEATSLFQWGRLSTVLIVIVLMVSSFDAISRRIRQALS